MTFSMFGNPLRHLAGFMEFKDLWGHLKEIGGDPEQAKGVQGGLYGRHWFSKDMNFLY